MLTMLQALDEGKHGQPSLTRFRFKHGYREYDNSYIFTHTECYDQLKKSDADEAHSRVDVTEQTATNQTQSNLDGGSTGV